jgi:hypothetical protein
MEIENERLLALADAVESALREARAADQAVKDASLAASAAFAKWCDANERYKAELHRQKELEKSEA